MHASITNDLAALVEAAHNLQTAAPTRAWNPAADDAAINRMRQDWVEAVYKHTHDRGADHILEIIGAAHLARSIEAAAVGGHISLIGILDGYEISGHVAHLARKKLRINGVQVGHRTALEDLVRAANHIPLRPVIAAEYALADLPSALDHLERGPAGKVVIRIN